MTAACSCRFWCSFANMGDFLFGLVGFFVRVAIRSAKSYRARDWLEVTDEIMSGGCKSHQGGCKVAEIYYKYYVERLCYADMHKEAFLWQESGENYVRRLPTGSEIK